MGRKPTVNLHMPPGMRPRKRKAKSGKVTVYYYLDTGGEPRVEMPLGTDYHKALNKYAQLMGTKVNDGIPLRPTFKWVAEQYRKKVIPKKALRTQKDNARELIWLYKFFNDPPATLDDIEAHHIAKYRDWRGNTRSTQELALFSHIWNWAREQGYTNKPNPTKGVARNRAAGREYAATQEVFDLMYKAADEVMRDAMDIAYLVAPRPADTFRFMETDVKHGVLHLRPHKTRKSSKIKLRFEIIGELKVVIDRIMARKQHIEAEARAKKKTLVRSLALLVNERGQAFTHSAMDNRWEDVRAAVVEELTEKGDAELAADLAQFQFRDLRSKAATDTEDAEGMAPASDLLGHTNQATTRTYVRRRQGKLIKPVK